MQGGHFIAFHCKDQMICIPANFRMGYILYHKIYHKNNLYCVITIICHLKAEKLTALHRGADTFARHCNIVQNALDCIPI